MLKVEKKVKRTHLSVDQTCFTSEAEAEESIFIAEAKGRYGHLSPYTQVQQTEGITSSESKKHVRFLTNESILPIQSIL